MSIHTDTLVQANFYKVIHNRKMFGYVYVILYKNSMGGGPGTSKCMHDPYFGELTFFMIENCLK